METIKALLFLPILLLASAIFFILNPVVRIIGFALELCLKIIIFSRKPFTKFWIFGKFGKWASENY